MSWTKHFHKPKPPPEEETPRHDQAALDAISRAEDSLEEGEAHLEEITARRKRLETVRHVNHFAPAINEAFKRRRP